MGKAAKCSDNFPVMLSKPYIAIQFVVTIELYGLILLSQIFTMHKGHIEKCSPLFCHLLIKTTIYSMTGNLHRFLLCAETLGLISIHVKRQLVQNDNER